MSRFSNCLAGAILLGSLLLAPVGAAAAPARGTGTGNRVGTLAALPDKAPGWVPEAPASVRVPVVDGELEGLLEGLLENYPELFGAFDEAEIRGMQADEALEVFGRVLDRIRHGEGTDLLDRSPVQPTEEYLDEAMALLRGLADALESGGLASGRLGPDLTSALSGAIPAEALQALEALRLQPAQVRELQRILQDLGPGVLTGSPEELLRLDGDLQLRLRKVFTPRQMEVLREAERLMRRKKKE